MTSYPEKRAPEADRGSRAALHPTKNSPRRRSIHLVSEEKYQEDAIGSVFCL